jgi:hypothetical protein
MEIAKTLHLFMKQIVSLDVDNKQANSYCILLDKIVDAAKPASFNSPIQTITKFLEANKTCLLTSPLVLFNYTLSWLNPVTFKKVFDIDLLTAFSKATDVQLKILHCHILKLATMTYTDESYSDLYEKLRLEVPLDFGDKEREIVDNLFHRLNTFEPLDISENVDVETVLENFQKNEFGVFLQDLRTPGLRWDILIKYLVAKIEELSIDQEPNPLLDTLISEIKGCNYKLNKLSPFKIVKLFSQFNLTKYMKPLQSLALGDGSGVDEVDTCDDNDGHCKIKGA